jgi:hypothetical protein
MKIVCAPDSFDFTQEEADLSVVLYGATNDPQKGAIGNGVPLAVRRARVTSSPTAWDLVSLALSVFAADLAGHRLRSPDGWTRTFDLHVAVSNPDLWSTCKETVEQLLRFLTTDLWSVSFIAGGTTPAPHAKAKPLEVDAAVLLSGGLDSLIGAIDQSSSVRSSSRLATPSAETPRSRKRSQMLSPVSRHICSFLMPRKFQMLKLLPHSEADR